MDAEETKKIEERQARKAARMLEKMGRMKLNDIILQVQDGVIPINALTEHIELRVKEVLENGRE